MKKTLYEIIIEEAGDTHVLNQPQYTMLNVVRIAERYRKQFLQHESSKWSSKLRTMEVGDFFLSNKTQQHMSSVINLFGKRNKELNRIFKSTVCYDDKIPKRVKGSKVTRIS